MHFKTVINFSSCTYWLEVVAQNSCFSPHRLTCSGWFMVSASWLWENQPGDLSQPEMAKYFEWIMIIFIVRPTIQPLENKTITEGGNLNLSCNASGTPQPVLSWVRISSGQQFNESLLQHSNVFRKQAGNYRCKATNECGTKSSTARIDVKCKRLFKDGVTTVYGRLVNT